MALQSVEGPLEASTTAPRRGFEEIDGVPPVQYSPANVTKLWFSVVANYLTSVCSVFGKQPSDEDSDETFFVKESQIYKEKVIGSGAQGTVFKGKLCAYGRKPETVAIKVVPNLDDLNFIVRDLRRIKHENLLQTLGVCVNSSQPFLVFEYCEGGSLYDYLHSNARLQPVQILSWMNGIAKGMHFLHSKNIIHRDLKSPNLLMVNAFQLKVSDFGTSRKFHEDSDITSFTGTLAWMAPEVIRHELYTTKADVWSFGVVVWEIITRQIPYNHLEQPAVMWGVGTDSVQLPIPKTVPKGLASLIEKCKKKDQKERPDFAKVIDLLIQASPELQSFNQELFEVLQQGWGIEAGEAMNKSINESEEAYIKTIQSARFNRADYKQQRNAADARLLIANEMFMEAASVRLQLEQRENDLAINEKIVREMVTLCRCGNKRGFKLHPPTSSSSEGSMNKNYRRRSQEILIQVLNKEAKPCTCGDDIRNDHVSCKKESIVTDGGQVKAASYGQHSVSWFGRKAGSKSTDLAAV